MKIGIVTTWFERGAAYVSRQYEDLLEKGHDVFIYARGGESYARGNPDWDRPNVTWGKKAIFQTNNSPMNRRDFEKWVKTHEIEAILFNEQQWWPPVLWARSLGVITGAYVDFYTEETVPLFEAYDFLICNTKRHLSAFDWHPGAHFLQWGTDVDLFQPGEKLEKDKDRVVFLLSAGMNPDRKGFLPLLKAFSEVKAKNAKLLIHSQLDLYRAYPYEKDLLNRLISEDRLEIVTETVPAPGLYYRADVYTYLSKLDGIGLTLAEAASSGLPIITPDQPPMNEFVEHGVTGSVVAVKRRYARADGYYWPQCEVEHSSLITILEDYAARGEEMSAFKKHARNRALERFSWKNNEQDLTKIFNEADHREVSKKLLKKIEDYEFRRMPYWPLLRLPYKMWQNLRR